MVEEVRHVGDEQAHDEGMLRNYKEEGEEEGREGDLVGKERRRELI